MLCELDAELLLHICEALPFQNVMLLRRVCRTLRSCIDSALVPVVAPDAGQQSHAQNCSSVACSSVDSRPRATLCSLLQLCCSPHLVLHSHSYGPDKSFSPALSPPATLVGAPLPGWGCARGSMSIGSNHALYTSHGACFAIPLAQRSNDCGQIGAVPPSPPLLTPLPLPLPLPCLQVACGECHSVALTSDGRVWTWGGAGFGQLGRGKGGKGGMAAVKFDAGDCFCFRIAAGAHHTLAAMQGGAVFAWGKGDEGQLGDCRQCSSSVPVRVLVGEDVDGSDGSNDDDGDGDEQEWEDATASDHEDEGPDCVVSCFAAGNMTILTTRAGVCYTCGDGCSGQQALPLERSGRRYATRPHIVNGLPPLLGAEWTRCSVACGGAHVVVAVHCVGQVQKEGAPRFCKQTSKDILEEASGLSSSFRSAAPNQDEVEIWGWGCNARGQLGPLAPSASVVVQPQRLHVLQSVAGLHHTALFIREIKAGGLPASQKAVDVIRQNGGWVKVYRSSAAAVQMTVTWFGMGESAAPSMIDTDSSISKPVECVRFIWGRAPVALARVNASVVAAASGGTKTLVLSCKKEG